MAKETKETKATRTIRVHSPAGPVHVLAGFVDDGAETITLAGLPEDEWGHWSPYYAATANGQALELVAIETEGAGG